MSRAQFQGMTRSLINRFRTFFFLQVMNMQWGKFISPHLPITEFDASVNSESENPGKRVYI